jgi:hypothetical protein
MSTNQEVCDDPIAILFRFFRTLSPELACKFRSLGTHRIEENS